MEVTKTINSLRATHSSCGEALISLSAFFFFFFFTERERRVGAEIYYDDISGASHLKRSAGNLFCKYEKIAQGEQFTKPKPLYCNILLIKKKKILQAALELIDYGQLVLLLNRVDRVGLRTLALNRYSILNHVDGDNS